MASHRPLRLFSFQQSSDADDAPRERICMFSPRPRAGRDSSERVEGDGALPRGSKPGGKVPSPRPSPRVRGEGASMRGANSGAAGQPFHLHLSPRAGRGRVSEASEDEGALPRV